MPPAPTTPLPSFGDEEAGGVVPYERARVAVLPVPYEGTVSYEGGTGEGPRAILAASQQLEAYDEELDREIDAVGFATLPPVDVAGDPATVMGRIRAAALPAVRDGKWLLTLGGEHSVTYGPLAAHLEARGRPFSILQLDAHADLRPSYHGTPHSHASIMARAHELGLPFVQVGLRAVSADERAFLREHDLERNVFWAHEVVPAADERWMDAVVERLGPDVYVTIDVDGLDPAIMPSTGTPVPGGLGWYPTLRLLRRVARSRRIIGGDVTELAPRAGQHAPDFLAARLAHKLIGYALDTE